MKQKLVFDASVDIDNVGAWLRAGTDGERIDSTTNALWVHLKASDVALNVELDHTDGDSVQIGDGTDIMLVNGDGSINAVVTATNLDIRDLTHVSDSVKIGDGTDIMLVNGDGSINVVASDVALANSSVSNEANSIGDVEEDLIASVLSARKYVFVHNNDNKILYIGATGVTTANGFPLYPGVTLEARIGASAAIKAIAPSGQTIDARILQAA